MCIKDSLDIDILLKLHYIAFNALHSYNLHILCSIDAAPSLILLSIQLYRNVPWNFLWGRILGSIQFKWKTTVSAGWFPFKRLKRIVSVKGPSSGTMLNLIIF